MKEKSIEWIILVTDKYLESRRFYKEILGLEIVRETAEEEFCQLRLKNCFLAIYGREQMTKLIGEKYLGKSGGAIYTFAESRNVDADYQNLSKKGVVFLKKPATQTWGQRTAYFADPDGHIWEIQQWLKKDD